MKKFLKKALWITVPAAIIAAGAVLFVWYCNCSVASCSEYCYADMDKLPESETALLLGAAKITPSGVPNLYFAGRIDAAAKLFHSGKIKHILISGDNSRDDYDEPTDMKNALIERGIPETAMTLDYAGFRTLDSVVRAKNVFEKDKYLIITQPGHAERAVYIARKHGVDASAFYAAEPTQLQWLVKRNRKREKYARIAAWLDVNIFDRKPKFEK
jgi:SanA protein